MRRITNADIRCRRIANPPERVMGENNELRNRHMLIDSPEEWENTSASHPTSYPTSYPDKLPPQVPTNPGTPGRNTCSR